MKRETTWAEIFMLLVMGVALLPWWAFVMKTQWAWFLVPLGVRPIGMAHALGISALFGMLKQSVVDPDEDKPAAYRIVKAALGPLILLGVGAAAHAIMVSG